MISWRTSGNDSQLIVRNLLLGLMCREGSLLCCVGAAVNHHQTKGHADHVPPMGSAENAFVAMSCLEFNSGFVASATHKFPHALWPGARRVMALPLSIT